MTSPEPSPPRRWTSAAVAIFVIGLLILVPSGLCSSAFLVGMLYSAVSEGANFGESLSVLSSVVLVGGPFIVVGAALTFFGWRMRSRK
jgi:hypothetical protein